MLFLQSPAVTASLAEWEQWLTKLRAMNGRDESVKFARVRAEQMLRLIAELDEEFEPEDRSLA